jgi:hypothetical protein
MIILFNCDCEVASNKVLLEKNVGGGEICRYRYYAYDIHIIVYQIMDNANAISTPSESYFALTWCSESDGLVSRLK